MGVALRNGISLQLRLVPSIWRALVGQNASFSDVDTSDEMFAALCLAAITKANDPLQTSSSTPTIMPQTYMSSGEEISLLSPPPTSSSSSEVTNHSSTITSTASRGAGAASQHAVVRCEAALVIRTFESWLSTYALQEGLTSVIPTALLPLFTPREFELRLCGHDGVDVKLLMANTDYDDGIGPSDEHIQSFWRVLTAFSDEERCKFLRFVWARPRLPANGDFSQRFKIQAPPGETAQGDLGTAGVDPDKHLPKAHTCFFSFQLPRYKSDEVMQKQLLYAINNCVTMDCDYRLTDSECTGWD
jgi:hypothetical protein